VGLATIDFKSVLHFEDIFNSVVSILDGIPYLSISWLYNES
jgi:hypothetical protein